MELKQRMGYARTTTKLQKKRMENEQCPTCGKPKKDWNRRTDWRCCSEKCTEEFNEGHYLVWQDFRLRAFKRDKFTCVKCGKNPVLFRERYDSENDENFKWRAETCDAKIFVRYVKEGYEVYDVSELVADHIKPIALGGDEWDLKNIQTLCIKHNKEKTKEDMAKIAKVRRLSKDQRNLK